MIGSSRNPLNFELSLNPLRVLAYFGMVFLHQQFLTSWIGLKRATWWQCQKGYCCASWFRTEVFHCLRSNLWNFPVQHIQEFCKNVGTEVFRTCPLRSKLQKALLWIVTIKITIIISATSKNTPSTQKNTHSKWFSTLCQYIFNSFWTNLKWVWSWWTYICKDLKTVEKGQIEWHGSSQLRTNEYHGSS